MTAAADLARLLRQRLELGTAPLFFEGLDREEVLALARAGRAAPGAAPAAPRPAIPGAAAPETPATRPPAAVVAPAAPPASPAPASPPATPGGGTALPMAHDLDAQALREAVAGCTRCRLHETRTQAVYADGVPDARVMVVGEAPGANEDRTGLPFVGAAGKLLDLMLASVDFSRKRSVYICNVIKCRPPGNRNPQQDEIDTCSPFLRRQIELVRPEAILAVGTFAAQLLTGKRDAALGKLRGQVHAYEGVPLVVTYHPAALLRNGSWTRSTWDDLQLLRQVVEGS